MQYEIQNIISKLQNLHQTHIYIDSDLKNGIIMKSLNLIKFLIT